MGRRRGGRRRRRRRDKEECDSDGGGPSRAHMETIVNYVTMTTDISLKLVRIIDKMKRFIGKENYDKLYKVEVKTVPVLKEMIKILKEKEPENCLQILVDALVECGCLENTGWKEKPDPISALLFELRESISVIERLMESVKEGDVNKVKQLLSQYPIPEDMKHITRECCLLSLERRDLTLVKFLYQEYRSMPVNACTLAEAIRLDFTATQLSFVNRLPSLKRKFFRELFKKAETIDNVNTLNRILNEAVRSDFTEAVQFLFSQRLPPECYRKLLDKAKSADMLRILLSEEKIRKSLNHDEPRFTESVLHNQILNSSTQSDCMSRVQILVDAGARLEKFIAETYRAAWVHILKERWFQVFDYLLNHLEDINFTNKDKQNVLHVFLVGDEGGDVRNNILDFVRNLVERGIDINSVDKDGESPLMLSCRAGYDDVVKYLSERGADVNKVDNKGKTALMWSCEKCNKDVVEYLIHHGGADVNKVDNDGCTTLVLACKKGHKDMVEYLIQHGGADVNKVDNKGKTALMFACWKGHKDIVEYLIQHGGADVNKVDNRGQTALIWTYIYGNKAIVQYLIQHGGADVNKVDNDGCTTLVLACKKGHKDIVEYLIQHGGADVNMVDNYRRTALMWACMEGYKDIVEYLIQHGEADVYKVEKCRRTALMFARESGYNDIVEYLIQHQGLTPLMLACEKGDRAAVEYLIQYDGADVNMEDKNGQTALYYCLGKSVLYTTIEQNDLFKFLVESGADLSLPSGVRLFEEILYRNLYALFLFVVSLKPQIVDVTDKGDNILHLLAKDNYEFTVGQFDWLFDCHVGINHENRHTDTPLMVAAVLLNEKYLKVFTHHPAVDLNKQNNHGHTALHCLILGFTELIQGFRQRHNERIAQNYCKQFYPKYMRCVDSLLGAGTDVNVQDNEGRTVLMMAVRENDKQLVRKLLDAGAMVDKVDRSGRHALHYVNFSDSVYDLAIFFLIFPPGENHLLDLPCINGNTLIQTVLQFPPRWKPCKVFAFVRWLVSKNCSLRHLRGRTGHSTYNDLSLDDFSCSQRQNLRGLLYRCGAPKEEIISTVNFQAEDEAENAIFQSRNREMFEQFCLNVSLETKCFIVLRQVLGTEIGARLPGLEIPHLNYFLLSQELGIPHLNHFLLLDDVVGDSDGGVLGGFHKLEDESDSCSYIVDKDRKYFHYLGDGMRDNTRVGGRPYSYYYELYGNDYGYDDDDDYDGDYDYYDDDDYDYYDYYHGDDDFGYGYYDDDNDEFW